MRLLEYLLDHTPRLDARPGVYGGFHIGALIVISLLFLLMILFRRRLPKSRRALRIALWCFALSLLLLELGKQIVYSYDPQTGWQYDWSRFPFQFCSTPIYAALIAAPLPDGRLRRTLLAFLATYSPVAGCAVLFWPSPSVFSPILFLDIHTMLWHGAMVLFGLFLWLGGFLQPTRRTALEAFSVFLPLNFVALALNELEHLYGFAGDYAFNMFYTSRYYTCHIPLLSWVQQNAPYPVFFASFVLLLGAGGAAVVLGFAGIRYVSHGRLSRRVKGEKTS